MFCQLWWSRSLREHGWPLLRWQPNPAQAGMRDDAKETAWVSPTCYMLCGQALTRSLFSSILFTKTWSTAVLQSAIWHVESQAGVAWLKCKTFGAAQTWQVWPQVLLPLGWWPKTFPGKPSETESSSPAPPANKRQYCIFTLLQQFQHACVCARTFCKSMFLPPKLSKKANSHGAWFHSMIDLMRVENELASGPPSSSRGYCERHLQGCLSTLPRSLNLHGNMYARYFFRAGAFKRELW